MGNTIHGQSAFILVASPSKEIDAEQGWEADPVYRDYALMKVIYMLRNKAKFPVYAFKWEKALVPVNFNNLGDQDQILIVGHGNGRGLYALGPDATINVERLVTILTKDGSLWQKRKGKFLYINLLSCRSGLGLHKALAYNLYKELKGDVDVHVGGALGFTFGSVRTGHTLQNEVLIRGLPWYMEYGANAISRKEAVKATQERENNNTITYENKKKVILQFERKKEDIEFAMERIVLDLKSTNLKDAIDELEKNDLTWRALIWGQSELYGDGQWERRSDIVLGFDMWYLNVLEGYVVAIGKAVSSTEVNDFYSQVTWSTFSSHTSIK